MSQEIADKFRAMGINVPHSRTSGQTKVRCPRCAQDAKHKNKTDLSINLDDGTFRCHNAPECNYKGWVNKQSAPEKIYTKPAPRTNITPLSPQVVAWFAKRKISQQTLVKMKIMDGPECMFPGKQKKKDGTIVHIPEGVIHTIQFPYFENGELVNIKYRSAYKQFKLVFGAKLIFYNLDSITDSDWCVICEGEIDALTFIEAGVDHVISVPNGASSGSNQRLKFLDNCWEYFEDKTKIILAMDDDEPGRALRAELIRRFGAERCFTVQYAPQFKDITDHVCGKTLDNGTLLEGFGLLSVQNVIDSAVPCPIEGVYTMSDMYQSIMDLYDEGLQPGCQIGLKDSDNNEELLSFAPGQMTVFTGAPNSAKSEACDLVIIKLALLHNWRFLIYSPENHPKELHPIKLIEKMTNKHFTKVNSNLGRLTKQDVARYKDFMQDHFFSMSSDHQKNEVNFSLDDVLSYGKKLITRYGINAIVIDPWNKLEHQKEYGTNSHEYIGKALNKITNFNRRNSVHTFIVAHPTKLKKVKDFRKNRENKGQMIYPIVTLYDISESSHWYNMVDNGVSMYRNYDDGTNDFIVQKVKNKHQGQVGSIKMTYNKLTGRLTPINTEEGRDWLRDGITSTLTPAIDFVGSELEPIITGNNNEEGPF